jgi:hypothetical protein
MTTDNMNKETNSELRTREKIELFFAGGGAAWGM